MNNITLTNSFTITCPSPSKWKINQDVAIVYRVMIHGEPELKQTEEGLKIHAKGYTVSQLYDYLQGTLVFEEVLKTLKIRQLTGKTPK